MCSRSTRTLTIPRSRQAARSPAGPTAAPKCTCSSRLAATRAPPIPTPTPKRSGGCASRRRPRRRVLGLGVAHAPSRPSRRRARRRPRAAAASSCARCARSGPTSCLCPDPTSVFFGDGYVNHRDHRVTGWATIDAVIARRRQPALLPGVARRRTRRAPAARACTCRARSIPTCGSTSPTRSTARSKRCSATRANSPKRASGSASSCATTAEAAGQAAGVTYAEGFRRIRRLTA